MSHFTKVFLQLTVIVFNSYANCLFLELKNSSEYSFSCEGKEINVSCSPRQEKDDCEADINVEIKKYNVQFANSKIISVNKLSNQDKTNKICKFDFGRNISCKMVNDCKNGIHANTFLKENGQIGDQKKCEHNNLEVKVCSILSDHLVSRWIDKLDIEKKIQDSCTQFDEKEKNNLSVFFKNVINPDKLRKSCFGDLKNEKDQLVSEELKTEIANKVSSNLMDFIKNDFKNCNAFGDHLSMHNNQTIDQFLCMKIQEVRPLQNINCLKGSETVLAEARSLLIASDKASGAAVASADTSGLENQTPKLIPKPAEMSEPILVKGTLAKIDEMLGKSNGIVTPEIKSAAGAMFNAGVYEPTRKAIDYLDEQFFTGEHKENGNQNHDTSGNGSSQNNGSRAPASKSFGKKERNSRSPSSSNKIAGSSGDDSISIAPGGVKAGLAGGESGDAVAASTAVNGGRAVNILDGKNKVAGRLSIDNQNGKQTGGVPPGTNPESTFAAGSGVGPAAVSGAGSGGLKVGSVGPSRPGGNVSLGSGKGSGATSGLGPGQTEIHKGVEVQPLNEKEKKELNQFANALKRIDNVKDLETVLRYSQNFPQLDYLIKHSFVQNESPGGNSRVPASKPTGRVSGASAVVDPTVEEAQRELVGRLKKFNVKVFDERIAKTVFDPTKGRDSDEASSSAASFIVRIDRNGNVRFAKPLRGTSKSK